MNKNCLKLCLLCTIFLLSAISSIAEERFSFNVSEATKYKETLNATVTAVVRKDYMLYRKQMSATSSNATVEATWPQTKMKKDPYGPGNIEVYPHGIHEIGLKIFNPRKDAKKILIKLAYQGCSSQTCYMPETMQIEIPNKITGHSEATENNTNNIKSKVKADKSDSLSVQTPDGTINFSKKLEEKGTLWVLFLALLGGLLVSLTPCVYPMIPITLSIIGSRKENVGFLKGLSLSATYVSGLSLVYAILGLVAATFGAEIRSIIQGTVFQVLISIAFFILALSMFDVFMLQIPTFIRDRLSGVKKGGTGSIFVMGMASGLMASPCVAAPLAGILTFIAITGSKIMGFFMLLFFAWGMSVPLLLIGAFSGIINSMPKAGSWMNKVKEFYGFLLFGASLYFIRPLIGGALSDLFTGVLLAALAAFLGIFDKIDENTAFFTKVLKGFGVTLIVLACAFIMSAAVKGNIISPKTFLPNGAAMPMDDIYWFDNLQKGLIEAKKTGKPVFVDFRADWCTICKELEHTTFEDAGIRSLFKKMVLVRIDATHPDRKIEKLMKHMNVVGLPTLIILNSQGEELKNIRTIGSIDAEELEKRLRKAL